MIDWNKPLRLSSPKTNYELVRVAGSFESSVGTVRLLIVKSKDGGDLYEQCWYSWPDNLLIENIPEPPNEVWLTIYVTGYKAYQKYFETKEEADRQFKHPGFSRIAHLVEKS